MEVSKEILFLLSAAGTLNGLLLAGYLLYYKKGRAAEDLFLGLLLVMMSIRIGKSTFLYFNPSLAKTYLQIGLSACFLIGPALYFYVKSAVGQPRRLPPSWRNTYLIQLLFPIVLGLVYPYSNYPEQWVNFVIPYIIYGNWTLFTIMSSYVLWQKHKSFKASPLVKIVITGNTLILALYILSYINLVPGSYISGSIMYSLILYLSMFLLLERRKNAAKDRYSNKKIDAERALLLLKNLENHIHSAEVYKNPDLKLGQLAQAIKVSPHILSQLLNDNLGKTFSNYINEFRIQAAAQHILESPHLRIEEIGYEVGFNSKSAFFTAFKKVNQTTPLKFRAASATFQKSPVL